MKGKLFLLVVLITVGLTSVGPAWADQPHNPIHTWNELALETVRSERLSDAQAARLYAMVNVAMYDAVNGIDRVLGHSTFTQWHVSSAGAPAAANHEDAAAAAAHAVLVR